MSHDIFNASSTATWIECSWSALNAVPDPPRKASTVEAAASGTASHAVMEAGRNPDVDIGTEDIWSQGGTWVPPTAARIHALVSSSAEDDPDKGGAVPGTGAHTVQVLGLNSSYAEVSETVTLNGTAPVNTATAYVIIYRMIVLTAGTSGSNVGNITATAATDATVTIAILAAKGQTQAAFYMIPAGKTGYLYAYGGSYNGAVNSSVTIELLAKPFGGAWNLKGSLGLTSTGGNVAAREYAIPVVYAAKTLLKIQATSDANNANVIGWFDLVLEG